MKKILFILFLGISILNTYSQNYYMTTKTIYVNGSYYRCDIDKAGFVTLYNANNKYTYTEWGRKDGKQASSDILLGRITTVEETIDVEAKANRIIRRHFSTKEIRTLKDSKFLITLIINSSTSKVDEIYFEFKTNSPPCSIPVSKYRAIEQDLLRNIYGYKVTAAGKEMNYCMHFWSYEF